MTLRDSWFRFLGRTLNPVALRGAHSGRGAVLGSAAAPAARLPAAAYGGLAGILTLFSSFT